MLNQMYVVLTGHRNHANAKVSVTEKLKLVNFCFVSVFHYNSNVLLLILKEIMI
jgi:hypothetical protein